MKYVTLFLVLSLVVMMAEPGECFFKHIKNMWRGAKAMFHGARAGWRGYRAQTYHQNGQGNEHQPPPYLPILVED
ncbi:pleurocidin-like peptide WF3 [Entelurus aequoreus]|uniref:pleurocidin-like peptide WF3 n=1 Tax=Entelurus aequoreus TaxID=161455 RepID=UPI002B1D4270|nr:pleurocidin-like peptide WF3 [Entelurus aequoreus]XP_061900890.1 pleurocidin-like peptide WF3 [Entelurus aequoreus]